MNEHLRPLILIVDDKQANLKALRILLRSVEADIVEAHTGNEALGLMLEQDFALVLLDVDMPDMNGFEVAQMAYQLETTRNLPILFLTAAYKDDFHRLQGYRAGAVDYIEKPIDEVILLSKVAIFLKLYNARVESERLRHELQINEERCKYALEGSNDGLWDWSIPSGRVFFSNRWYEMLGYHPDELEPHIQTWERLIHPEDRDMVQSSMDALLVGHATQHHTEHRLRMRNGAWLWILDRGKVVAHGRDGRPLRAVGTHQDISERKRMEDEIRASHARYEQLTARIPVGVYKVRLDVRGTFAFDYVSDPFCSLLGMDRAAIMHDFTNIFATTHPEERQRFIDYNQQCANAREPIFWIGRFLVHGRTHWLQIQSKPQVEQNGDTLWDGVVIDITERKLLENALRASRQEAEQANQAKSRFLATMSHDIRTPMNTILGVGQILTRSVGLTAKEQQLLRVANRAGDALMALIDDILDLSKIEAGQLSLEQIPFPLRHEIHTALEIIRANAQAKGIRMAAELDPGLPDHVVGDPRRLRQILLNLLGNAIKFTHQGEVVLGATLGTDATLHFSVRDTGIGIPANRLEAIFEPFKQAEDSTTRRFGGSGLGLNICQQLVSHMGGEIRVESREGVGSTFCFSLRLPRADPPIRERVDSDTLQDAATLMDAPIPNPRILLVDDTEDNRLVVQAFLELSPCRLQEASSGEEALRLFEHAEFDLVLMDVMMPDMDGLETTRRLRTREAALHRRRIPVIALTGNAMQSDREQTKAAGCDFHLAKPLRRDELLDVLDRFLGMGGSVPIPLPTSNPPEDVMIDQERLAQLRRDTGANFSRLLEMFLANLPGRLQGMRTAWERQEPDALQQLAHRLKGMAATMGLVRLTNACIRLERESTQGVEPDSLLASVRQLEEVAGQLPELLTPWLDPAHEP
ncbi:MAG: response regulator [Magnetococcales bacterium]|nr:response regulator [Magnetococcales bacterium]